MGIALSWDFHDTTGSCEIFLIQDTSKDREGGQDRN